MSDDDDFYSDGDSKQKLQQSSSLMPIIEVPSESGSRAPSTARTESDIPDTQRSQNEDDDYYSDECV